MSMADSKIVLEQLLQVTAKESHYLRRTAARLQALGIDMAWIQALEENDRSNEMVGG